MADVEIAIAAPREDLVNTAVSFFQNPKVRNAPLSEKESFLRSKGLTEDEIRLAFERSVSRVGSIAQSLPLAQSYSSQKHPHHTALAIFQIFKNVTVVIGAAYAAYYFFKNVILPWLFGKPKKPDHFKEQMKELDLVNNSISQLRVDVQKVSSDLDKINIVQVEQQMLSRNLGDLKSELATVKGILLSRHQFPTVNLTGSTSIPAWQMAACRESADSGDEGKSIEVEAGHPTSNSGSQGSDSSLEMIREAEVTEVDA